MAQQGTERQKRNDFSQGRVWKAILGLAGPMILAQVINVLYSVVDRMYLGRLPGHLALTGLGLTTPILFLVTAFANLCGGGGAPLCSIARGRGDTDEAERVMGNSFTLLMLLGGAVMLFCLLWKRPMLYLFGASDTTFPYADAYLTIYLCGTLFVMVSLGLNPFINSQGFGRVGMMTVGLGAVVNIVLDPIFIFRLGLGVRGAALATIIAQGCSAVWVLRFLTGEKAILRLKPGCMRLEARRVKDIIALGLANFFASLTNAVVQIVCNATLQRYGGDLYVGVMTILHSLREVCFQPMMGLLSASQPVLGYNLGADKPDRVRQGIRFTAGVVCACAAAAWLLLELAPGIMIRLFTSDPAMLAAGTPSLRIFFSMFPFMSLQLAGQSIYAGLGKARYAICFSVLRKTVIAAPLTLLLPWLGLGTAGVFAAEAVSQLVGGLASFTTMYFVVYRALGKETR